MKHRVAHGKRGEAFLGGGSLLLLAKNPEGGSVWPRFLRVTRAPGFPRKFTTTKKNTLEGLEGKGLNDPLHPSLSLLALTQSSRGVGGGGDGSGNKIALTHSNPGKDKIASLSLLVK